MKKQRVKNLAKSGNSQAAKEYAFLLLKFRLRSEKELAQRLRQKKFSETIIQDTLTFLKDKQFIDDQIFALADKYDFQPLDNAVRGWIALSGFEKDQQNYNNLSDLYNFKSI